MLSTSAMPMLSAPGLSSSPSHAQSDSRGARSSQTRAAHLEVAAAAASRVRHWRAVADHGAAVHGHAHGGPGYRAWGCWRLRASRRRHVRAGGRRVECALILLRPVRHGCTASGAAVGAAASQRRWMPHTPVAVGSVHAATANEDVRVQFLWFVVCPCGAVPPVQAIRMMDVRSRRMRSDTGKLHVTSQQHLEGGCKVHEPV
jgi:hypothetical protein